MSVKSLGAELRGLKTEFVPNSESKPLRELSHRRGDLTRAEMPWWRKRTEPWNGSALTAGWSPGGTDGDR